MTADEQRERLARLDEKHSATQKSVDTLVETFRAHEVRNSQEHSAVQDRIDKVRDALSDGLKRVHDRMDKVVSKMDDEAKARNAREWKVAGATILLLLGILGTLLYDDVLFKHEQSIAIQSTTP